MTLNVINNFKALYYNTLVNFYIYFNTVVPCYDDVILSLSITSFKNIINNHSISLKSIKENRLMKLIYSLNDKDKIVLDDDGFVFVDFHPDNTTMLGFDDDDEEEGTEETPVVTEETPVVTEETPVVTEETPVVTEETPEETPEEEPRIYDSLEKKNN
jgi:hypothetical protein